MRRWVVLNGYRTSDAYDFQVYIDSHTENDAKRLAVPYFEYLAKKFGNVSPEFTDPTLFTAIPVSAAHA